jgi:ArsR family transcriptional regulator, arsenate/arsenite/antimonite-responsive transcriptional repressor
MKRKTPCCCGTPAEDGDPVTELPEPIQRDLDAMGGLTALTKRIPSQEKLDERSRVYHALSDPLRLSILYIIRDQPLCVCVINRFMRLSGSKLSYHLNILKENGLIEGESQGNWIVYSITDRARKLLRCTEHAEISAETGCCDGPD